MSLIDVNWKPSHRQLRQFAIISLFALPLIGWIWGASPTTIGWLAAGGAVLAVTAMVWPAAIKPVFLAMTLIAVPIGIVIGEVALVLIYFGLFLPIGLVFRLMRRDALGLRRDPAATTYWRPKAQPSDMASYYRQY